MKVINRFALAALVSFAAVSAQAAPTVVSVNGGAPTGTNLWNLDTGTGITDVLQVTLEPDAAFVTGSSSGIYAAPFLSGNNGTGFGSPNQPNGQDTTRYLTTGSTGAYPEASVTITFEELQQYFGLLWGSVDLYNSIEFFSGNTSLGSVTGVDVTAAANGDQGAAGTFYVNIDSDVGFDRLVFTSTQYAFEFDNISWDKAPSQVPEPSTLALLGMAALGLGLARRRQRGV